jgi:hypothetical protein
MFGALALEFGARRERWEIGPIEMRPGGRPEHRSSESSTGTPATMCSLARIATR